MYKHNSLLFPVNFILAQIRKIDVCDYATSRFSILIFLRHYFQLAGNFAFVR